jgi:Predicted hydrolases or acyltransferases (alpha/beta hydrolase superfamily)
MSKLGDKFVNYEGSKIQYSISGAENNGDWVVLLHGKRFTVDDWKNSGLLDKLADSGFKTIALNLPGYGHSETLKSDKSYADFLAGFMRQLGINLFHLIGPSFSGEISIQFAIQYSSMLKTLIIIDSINVDKYEQMLPNISTKTLIVWGKNDEIAYYQNALTLQEKLLSSTLYTFEGLGHTCYFDNMPTFSKVLLHHLDQH